MVLVIIGAMLKIASSAYASYVIIAGLVLEAYTLGSLVIQSLKKVK